MASYTIEDIELIRRKSGISYQEAVSLLDYHNGNVARALVDLERNGRLKPDAAAQDAPKSAEKKASTAAASKSKGGFMHFINKLYRARVKVARQSIPILNISLLFTLVAALISPHLLILSCWAIVCRLTRTTRISRVKTWIAWSRTPRATSAARWMSSRAAFRQA